MDELKLLIVGGYGIFGGRIIELLQDEPRLVLIVAGRSMLKAVAFCQAKTGAKAKLVAAAFDRDGDLPTQLEMHRPNLVIDASGPFQAYGDDCYRLIHACIDRGIAYLDLADGSEFVAGVRAFDAKAKAAGVYALSGVSSFPVLTAAVVRRLSGDMSELNEIAGGIAPSPFAGVGENVIQAIASYAGQPIQRRQDGGTAIGRPFTESRRYTISPPGHLPLRSTLFSLVDVPDLRALPELWPGVGTVWMGAGPVPEIFHGALIAFAWLVRWNVVRSLSPLARLMHFATNRLSWGEHRGGMFIEVNGKDGKGATITRSWHLLAEGDDGPLIPSMAVEAIVRRALDGQPPAHGARAATVDLELGDYERLFEHRAIYTGIRDDSLDKAPLYAHLLGSAWHSLPQQIRHMHQLAGSASASGSATVERGTNPLARLAASLFRFPAASGSTLVDVRFAEAGGVETWTRTFGTRSFASRQFAGHGRSQRLLCERFGPFTFAMALVVKGDRLDLVLRRWSAFGIPLPMWLCPQSTSYETVKDGRFRFHVEIRHPFVGLIVSYRGWLEKTA